MNSPGNRAGSSLRNAVMVSVVLPMLALIVVASLASFGVTNIWSTSALERQINELAKSSSVTLQELLWRYDTEELQVVLDNFIAAGVLIGATVTDGQDVVVRSGSPDQSLDVVQVTETLRHVQDGQMVDIGTMTFVASKDSVYALGQRRAIALVVISSISIILTMTIIFWLLRRRIIRPIAEIEAGLAQSSVAGEALDFKFTKVTNRKMIHELRAVVDAIYTMRSRILQSRAEVQEKDKKLVRAAMLAGLGYGAFDLANFRFVECDENLAGMLGFSVEETLGLDLSQGNPLGILDHSEEKRTARRAALASGQTIAETFRIAHKNGDIRHIRVILDPKTAPGSQSIMLELVAQDITEQHQSEQRAHQAEKLQTIGKLTGGVAHDFNNILAIISGNLERIDDAVTDKATKSMAANALGAVDRGPVSRSSCWHSRATSPCRRCRSNPSG
ncbi:MAG: PAS domain S-box protein [Pseudomonadota bacterium]